MKEFIAGFEECFSEIKDERRQTRVAHPLIEVLFLTIAAVAAGASSWGAIEDFGLLHLQLLREYYPFKYGIPSDDTIRRVFEILNPETLNHALKTYFAQGLDLKGQHVAIDGKTLRGAIGNRERALHFLNVYASGSGLTLYGKEVDQKTNEIKAIPEAIEALDIKGATVTIDAMGCQKEIAKQIIAKEADYIFGLKENQVSLYNEVQTAFATNAKTFFDIEEAQTEEKGHGRIEHRVCRVIRNLTKIERAYEWSGINAVIELKRTVTHKDQTTQSTSYYITSSKANATEIMKMIRSHWQIESMHWVLDVTFKEDGSSMHKGNIPANMAIIRRFTLNIIGQMTYKRLSRPRLMNMIGWSEEYLHVFIQKLIKCT